MNQKRSSKNPDVVDRLRHAPGLTRFVECGRGGVVLSSKGENPEGTALMVQSMADLGERLGEVLGLGRIEGMLVRQAAGQVEMVYFEDGAIGAVMERPKVGA